MLKMLPYRAGRSGLTSHTSRFGLNGFAGSARFFSLSKPKPLLLDVLPQRKLLNRLLFDFDARLNLNKYLPIIQDIYDCMDTEKEPQLPKKVTGSDLLLFQKILNEIRLQTHTSNKYIVDLEEELIERAAELGSRDALTLISFKAINDDGTRFTNDDKLQAEKFIHQLIELNHPLVFKMQGDREFTEGKLNEAIKTYQQFLKLDSNSFLSADVYKTLGMIYFQQQLLLQAKFFFEKSINLAPLSKVSQSHFMLGLIHEADPLRSRYHFEMAATQGFKESFQNLGFLELNYFHNAYKAKEWFKLGSELGDYNCMLGLFDTHVREQNWDSAKKTYDKLVAFLTTNNVSLDLESIRADSISKMNAHLQPRTPITTASSSRWSQ